MTNNPEKKIAANDSFAFLHLSDIHFGQERGGQVFFNSTVKNDLVRYVGTVAEKRYAEGRRPIDGILVTGDIAFSGQKSEYHEAANWLAQIADKVGCPRTSVHVVPGNHDVDRSKVSPGIRDMIDRIVEQGQPALDEYMDNKDDRERLYERFHEYRIFAAGYDCVLDREGGSAGAKDFKFSNGLTLRFLGLNSALVCRGGPEDKAPGKLFLGMKQRIIDRIDGVEFVVLVHHPMNWLADQADSWDFLKTRARVFISGHEHSPNLQTEEIEGNGKILRIDSGAIVPPDEADGYGYTFNIVEFTLDPSNESIDVKVQGHLWDRTTTAFTEDQDRFDNGHETVESLQCPMFAGQQNVGSSPPSPGSSPGPSGPSNVDEEGAEVIKPTSQDKPQPPSPSLPELRLRFFHDLTPIQRLQVLVNLGIFKSSFSETLTTSTELAAINTLETMGLLGQLESEIQKITRGETT